MPDFRELGWIVQDVAPTRESPRIPPRNGSIPSVTELEVKDLLAPECDPYRYFSAAERAAALWLTTNGVTGLRSVQRRTGERERTPDGIFDHRGDRVTVEIKSPDAPKDAAVHRNIRNARKQSRIIVLDYRGTGLTRETGSAGVRRGVRHYGQDIDQIVVVLDDGSAIGWKS